MMRTFGRDALDVSNINGDGWIVCQNLIASSVLERCPAKDRSVHWMHTNKQDEEFVAMSTRAVWAALQQATRAFLAEELDGDVVASLLDVNVDLVADTRARRKVAARVRVVGHWLALRASQRTLSHVAYQAACCLRIYGYDPLPGRAETFSDDGDGKERRDINRLLPAMHKTWARKSPQILAEVPSLVEEELDILLGELAIDREQLARCILRHHDDHHNQQGLEISADTAKASSC
jgi:hypothetical protein